MSCRLIDLTALISVCEVFFLLAVISLCGTKTVTVMYILCIRLYVFVCVRVGLPYQELSLGLSIVTVKATTEQVF